MSVVTTHSMLKRIKQYAHLLGDYHLLIDEVPEPVEQLDVSFGKAVFNSIFLDEGIVDIESGTNRMLPTDKWEQKKSSFEDSHHPTDKLVMKLMNTLDSRDVCYVDSTYFAMDIPKETFESSKSLSVFTFLFEGTKLDHFLTKKRYSVKRCYCSEERDEFWSQLAQLLTIEKPKKDSINCGFTRVTGRDKSTRDALQRYLKGFKTKLFTRGNQCIDGFLLVSAKGAVEVVKKTERILHGTGLSKIDCIRGITRGTNQYINKTSMIYCHRESLNSMLAKRLGMNNQEAKDKHMLSELIQVIYRMAIRRGEPVTFYTPDTKVVEVLESQMCCN